MQSLEKEVKQELTGRIIPFWEGLRDEEYGGFYGYQDFDLNVQKTYEKGCILNSRILWFFSNAYLTLKDEKLRADAEHAYRFMKQACVDREYGGVFWSVTYDGKPLDTTKHTYNQAFAIYALSTYFDATGDTEALELAKSLQQIIETHCTDEYGYLEAFTRDFKPESNEKLSENGVMAEKTMNTLLHVFEAYTELYRVTKDPFTGDRLRFMMDLFADKVYNKEKGRQEVFFDRTWNTLIDLYSYVLQICKGHENLESVSRRTETSTGFAIWAFMPDSSAFRRSSSNAFAVMATIGISPRFPGSARIASAA